MPTAAPLGVNTLDAQPAPQAEPPAFDLDEVVGTVLSYQIDAGSLKPARHSMRAADIPDGMIEPISDPVPNERGGWDVTVTLRSGTAADYAVPEGYLRGYDADSMVMDPSAETKLQFVASTYDATSTTWQCFASDRAECTFVFQEAAQVPTAPTKQEVADIQGALGYKILNADGSEAYSARANVPEDAIESIGEVHERDGGYYVDVTVAAKDAPPTTASSRLHSMGPTMP